MIIREIKLFFQNELASRLWPKGLIPPKAVINPHHKWRGYSGCLAMFQLDSPVKWNLKFRFI